MVKRLLIAFALIASLGGAVVGCNTPAGTTSPAGGSTTTLPSSAPSLEASPSSSEALPSAS